MLINRPVQQALSRALRDAYPDTMLVSEAAVSARLDTDAALRNLYYLTEHGLVESKKVLLVIGPKSMKNAPLAKLRRAVSIFCRMMVGSTPFSAS